MITIYTRKYLEKGVEELLIERRGGLCSEIMTKELEVKFLRKFDEKIDASTQSEIERLQGSDR